MPVCRTTVLLVSLLAVAYLQRRPAEEGKGEQGEGQGRSLFRCLNGCPLLATPNFCYDSRRQQVRGTWRDLDIGQHVLSYHTHSEARTKNQL